MTRCMPCIPLICLLSFTLSSGLQFSLFDEESERERVQKMHLGKLARKRFEAMLRSLSGKRGEMARCMTFCLEHAEAAHEVSNLTMLAIINSKNRAPRWWTSLLPLYLWMGRPYRAVARLHLICAQFGGIGAQRLELSPRVSVPTGNRI